MPNLIDVTSFKKKPFEVINKSETVAEILLYGTVGEDWFDSNSVSATQFKNALKDLPASTKEIHLRVNSPGGSVFDGMSMYELLKSEKNKGKKVIAYVDGLAASIASVIILAADEIVVGDGSFVMIHKPMVGAFGNAAELERMINVLDKIEDQMLSIYAKKTGLSKAEISKMLSEETWLTSAEALEKGFADKSFQANEQLRIAASAHITNAKHFMKRPEVKRPEAVLKEKLAKFNAEAKDYLNKKK